MLHEYRRFWEDMVAMSVLGVSEILFTRQTRFWFILVSTSSFFLQCYKLRHAYLCFKARLVGALASFYFCFWLFSLPNMKIPQSANVKGSVWRIQEMITAFKKIWRGEKIGNTQATGMILSRSNRKLTILIIHRGWGFVCRRAIILILNII